MKKNEIFLIHLIFSVCFFAASASARPPRRGAEMCGEVLALLRGKGCAAAALPPVYSAGNDFPFSVLAEFPAGAAGAETAEEKAAAAVRDTLLLVFDMENVYPNMDAVGDLIDRIRPERRSYALSVLFLYGALPGTPFPGIPAAVNGASAFIESADTSSAAAVCVSFSAGKAAVIPGSGGDVSPAWLTRRLSGALAENGIRFDIRGGNMSSLYRLRVLQDDPLTAEFLGAGIPAAGVSLPPAADAAERSRCVSFLADFLNSYAGHGDSDWDRHPTMLRIGDSAVWLGERFVVLLFMAAAATGLFLVCEFSFILHPERHKIRRDVTRLLFVLPLAAVSVTLFFTFGQGISNLLFGMIPAGSYLRIAVKLVTGFFLISLAFMLILRLQGVLSESAYSYLPVFAALFNLFLYCAVDISLFYLFAAECVVAGLSLAAKNTASLSLAFVLMLAPFLPYAVEISRCADARAVARLADSPFSVNFAASFATLPPFILWLRILARLNRHWAAAGPDSRKFFRQNLTAVAGALVIFAAALTAVTILLPDRYKRRRAEAAEPAVTETDDGILQVSVADRSYFGETARIVTVETGAQAERCLVDIRGEDSGPVSYSDSPYLAVPQTATDSFLIPAWPPERMQFRYIADPSRASSVTATALYPDGADGAYSLRRTTVAIPAAGKDGGR